MLPIFYLLLFCSKKNRYSGNMTNPYITDMVFICANKCVIKFDNNNALNKKNENILRFIS